MRSTSSRTALIGLSLTFLASALGGCGDGPGAAVRLAELGAERLALSTGAEFYGIGDLAGGAHASAAYDVSADGSKVVGYGTGPGGARAVIWTLERGPVAIADTSSAAQAISDDGEVIAGFVETVPWPEYGNTTPQHMTARWEADAPVAFVPAPYRFFRRCDATAVSGDGEVVLGRGNQYPPEVRDIGFVWRGSTFNLGAAYVRMASNFDGSAVAGVVYRHPRYGGYTRAVLNDRHLPYPEFQDDCTSEYCLAPCTGRPTDCEAAAYGISEDGLTVVGAAEYVLDDQPRQAVRWQVNAASGAVSSEFLSPYASEAVAVSGAGRIVAGYEQHDGVDVATLWIDGAAESIEDVLRAAGVLPEGWRLTQPHALSPDGRFVVGEGINPNGDVEGWVASLPGL